MEILFLLLLFQIKHWYADFKIQTYMQTVKKGVWLDPIGMSHTLDHVWTTMVALTVYSLFFNISAASIVLVALLEGIYHYMVDYVKVRYGSKDNTKPLFWNQFGLDQMAHQLSYLIIALYICVI